MPNIELQMLNIVTPQLQAPAEERSINLEAFMLDVGYLARGLTGACNALGSPALQWQGKPLSRWFSAHFGLALMAAYWLCREFDLDEETCAAVAGNCDRVTQRYPDLFKPLDLAAGTPDPAAVTQVADTLREGIGRYVRSGHNVTYSAYVLKALHEHPEWTTPEVVRRCVELVQDTSGELSRQDAPVPADDRMAPYQDTEDMIRRLFRDMVALDLSADSRSNVNVGHILTHAHALVELDRLGYRDLARAGLDAHRAHVANEHVRPPRDEPSDRIYHHKDPLTAAFWQGDVETHRSWEVGHTFKYPYSFHRVKSLVRDAGLVADAERQMWQLV